MVCSKPIQAGQLLAVALAAAVFTAGCSSMRQRNIEDDTVAGLQQSALSSGLAMELLTSLTSEVGPRMAGSAGDARAVAWAVEKMQSLGFGNVRTQPVTFPRWRRYAESAEVLSPWPQKLVVTALGGSPATDGPLDAEVVRFDTLEALEESEPEQVAGRIVFLHTRMPRTREGSGYGATVPIRTRGPFVAASKGALALLIRSVGTDSNRLPHTGMMSGSEPGEPVPAAALSGPDADNLDIMLDSGRRVRVRLDLDTGFDGEATSYNVIGEIPGQDPDAGFLLLGAHLDSWDPGTGAIDDGAGVAIVMAAARLVADLPERPRRGLRVVLYANEEQGVYGGKAYARMHESDLDHHVLGAESDRGADRVYAFRTRTLPSAEATIERLAHYLAPLGIAGDDSAPANGGADVGQMRKLGMPVIDLVQDATRYFDWHHTANDTLDKVDPGALQQNVAAWATMLYVIANSTDAFGPVEPSE